jgi:hypothetical protein
LVVISIKNIYLGITLQSDLKWIPHTNNIVANANKSLGFFKRNLEYACSVWDLHTAEHCNKIEMIQRRQLHLGMPATDTINNIFTSGAKQK